MRLGWLCFRCNTESPICLDLLQQKVPLIGLYLKFSLQTWAGHRYGKFEFQLGHGQNVFHLTPLEQSMPLENFEEGLQTTKFPRTSTWDVLERQKYLSVGKTNIENHNLFLQWPNVFQIT